MQANHGGTLWPMHALGKDRSQDQVGSADLAHRCPQAGPLGPHVNTISLQIADSFSIAPPNVPQSLIYDLPDPFSVPHAYQVELTPAQLCDLAHGHESFTYQPRAVEVFRGEAVDQTDQNALDPMHETGCEDGLSSAFLPIGTSKYNQT